MSKSFINKLYFNVMCAYSGGASADVPSAALRFSCSDEKAPSLVMSDSAMELGVKIFSRGKFKIPYHFEELTKLVI